MPQYDPNRALCLACGHPDSRHHVILDSDTQDYYTQCEEPIGDHGHLCVCKELEL